MLKKDAVSIKKIINNLNKRLMTEDNLLLKRIKKMKSIDPLMSNKRNFLDGLHLSDVINHLKMFKVDKSLEEAFKQAQESLDVVNKLIKEKEDAIGLLYLDSSKEKMAILKSAFADISKITPILAPGWINVRFDGMSDEQAMKVKDVLLENNFTEFKDAYIDTNSSFFGDVSGKDSRVVLEAIFSELQRHAGLTDDLRSSMSLSLCKGKTLDIIGTVYIN
ncbi:hypothetical protein [Serratia sp. Se-RSBMAAmG]|uniref:hypothetical protein n=1 Tax=Serratia sp. Se-RSBMAAmG TaxID=3043305 RepID=UPI0024AEF260|nr:hypothetical protein [Serratia sp. Se-RSBMAAmG]MDI6977156.1 hypothetical protein [Serratia sp. Se-RSBMAAmG]